MKNLKYIFILGFICLIVFALNFKQSNNEELNLNRSLFDVQLALAQDPESGYGPTYKACGKDPCEVQVSVGVYTVTEYGNYWHCKSQYEVSSCLSSRCDVKCDAI